MENGCTIEINKDVLLYAKWLKIFENEGIKVIGDDDVIADVVQVQIEQISNTKNISDVLSNNLLDFVAYEVDLLNDDGSKVQPNGYVKVLIPIPTNVDKENLVVYRIDGENIIEYDVIIDNNFAIIETNHFSTYIIGEKNAVSNPNTSDNILLYFSLTLILFTGCLIITRKLRKQKI